MEWTKPSTAALLTYLPWALWRHAHDITTLSSTSVGDAFDFSYLSDRTYRIGPAARVLANHIFNPQEWLVLVSLLLVLCAIGLALRRRLVWLGPAVLCAATYWFWVWVNWADHLDLTYRLGTSAFRVVDGLMLSAGVLLAFAAEALLRSRRAHPAR